MQPDDKVCYCYHVSLRKLANYARQHHLQRPSQLSECFGAGTGCGWCIPFLKRIYADAQSPDNAPPLVDLTPEEYAQRRQEYLENHEPRNRF